MVFFFLLFIMILFRNIWENNTHVLFSLKRSFNQTVVEINDQDRDCDSHSLVCFLAPGAWEQRDLTAAVPSCNSLEGRRVELHFMRSGAGLAWTVSFSVSSLSYFMKTQVTFSPTEVFVVRCNHGAV